MKSKPNIARWALGGLVLAVVLLYGFTVHRIGERPQAASADIEDREGRVESRSRTRSRAPTKRAAVVEPLPAHETAPWQATEVALPPGSVPVAHVDPPPPDPHVVLPPPPVEPSNPALHRPPLHNPGGVDRDRPPRPVPGLERQG
jgi:hypothetical protein